MNQNSKHFLSVSLYCSVVAYFVGKPPDFKSRLGQRLPRLGFLVLFLFLHGNFVEFLKFGHVYLIPHSFVLILHESSYHSTLMLGTSLQAT
jgi:hypothetical protein